jgi:regulation of enolase protein 1 (concanavalin A-like superfamily)
MARTKQMTLQFLLRGYILVKAAEDVTQMISVPALYEALYECQADLRLRIEAEGLYPCFLIQRDVWRLSSVVHTLSILQTAEGLIEISANARKVRFKIESEQEALEMLSRKSMWNLQVHMDLAFLIDATMTLPSQSTATPTPIFTQAEEIKRIA